MLRTGTLQRGHRRPVLAGFTLLFRTTSVSVNKPDAEAAALAAAVCHRKVHNPRIGLLRDRHSHKAPNPLRKGYSNPKLGTS
jgi:hypothetical protein